MLNRPNMFEAMTYELGCTHPTDIVKFNSIDVQDEKGGYPLRKEERGGGRRKTDGEEKAEQRRAKTESERERG